MKQAKVEIERRWGDYNRERLYSSLGLVPPIESYQLWSQSRFG